MEVSNTATEHMVTIKRRTTIGEGTLNYTDNPKLTVVF